MPEKPEVIDNIYEIIRPLGEGGMAEVFLANDLQLHRQVAVKLMNPGIARNRNARARFMKEARQLAQLNNPNLATIHHLGGENDRPYMVLEYIAGTAVDKIVKRGRVPVAVAVPILLEVLNGIEHVHSRRIVHRDIKPSNIIVTPEGHSKVIDFGIALDQDAERRTMAGAILCTPAYASPEQAAGKTAEIDRVSDIYSLGAMFFELLTGKPPLERDNDSATLVAHATEPSPPLPTEFGRELGEVVSKSLAREKADRYQTAGDFKSALSNAVPASSQKSESVAAYIAASVRPTSRPTVIEADLADSEEIAPPPKPVDRTKTTSRTRKKEGSRRSWIYWAAAGAFLVAAAIGLSAWKVHQTLSEPIPPPVVVQLPEPELPHGWDTLSAIKPEPHPATPPAPVAKVTKPQKAPEPPALTPAEIAQLEASKNTINEDLRKSSVRLQALKALNEEQQITPLEKHIAELRGQLDIIQQKLSQH